MQEMRNKILEMIKLRGPSLPVQISKQIGTNSIMAGAILATLLEQKYLKISNAKIGGSPVYYIEGQENRLGQALYSHLKEVHRKVYDLLKQNLVLEDVALEPWQRVALRELGDFAKKLTIYTGEIFWKWHLISDKEAEDKIKELIGFDGEGEKDEAEKEEVVNDVEVVEDKSEHPQNLGVEEKIEIEMPKQEIKFEDVGEINVEHEALFFDNVDNDENIGKEDNEEQKSLLEPDVKVGRKKRDEKIVKEKPKYKRLKEDKKEPFSFQKKNPREKERLEVREKIKKAEVDDIFNSVDEYFNARKIEVVKGEMISKGKEYEFIVNIPSNVGKVKFFVKYRNKKNISEGDLSLALIKAAERKLPLLFLSNGGLNAKARDYCGKNGVVFEKI